MATGLQIWDASGNLVLDASYRVMRIISSITMDGTNGSRPDSRLAQGGFVSFQPNVTVGEGFLSGGVITPRFSIDAGGTLTWSYAPKNSVQYDIYQTGILFYGAS
ncbi:hypothetical protein [Paraburkholderia domus]|uniref:hypothetical protein n=1 Tax=Paraburkholderia domus TaxID=2793075 RepID=UPI0019125F39|nr:hypothetical protein [Paraburkholderia domus]MBK5058889.1 hypothetical protein [Burkholderia sp. R-70199]CAE6879851.1 hypothetical protein R70199_02459 [Paraburkholderia domus]